MKHRLFFDRDINSIEGLLTLLRIEDDGEVVPVFKRVPARSGQWGHTKTSWKRGKSPIPFGNHWMSTTAGKLYMAPYGTRFYRIGSEPNNLDVIKDKRGNQRTLIGLHKENQYNGSAGCIVVVSMAMADKMFDYIDSIKEGLIEVIVL